MDPEYQPEELMIDCHECGLPHSEEVSNEVICLTTYEAECICTDCFSEPWMTDHYQPIPEHAFVPLSFDNPLATVMTEEDMDFENDADVDMEMIE